MKISSVFAFLLTAVMICAFEPTARAETARSAGQPVKASLIPIADRVILEVPGLQTGVSFKRPDGRTLNNIIKVVAIKEGMRRRPGDDGNSGSSGDIAFEALSILAEPSKASILLREHFFSNHEFPHIVVFVYLASGHRYEISAKGARLRSVGTRSYEGRIVDDYVFEMSEANWHYFSQDGQQQGSTGWEVN